MTAIHLPDEAATRALAATLAQTAPASAVVYLHGDLGSGKSTLAAPGCARWRHGTRTQPTYTLVERDPLADGGEALHLDLYRIGAAGELEYLGLDDS